MIYGELGRYPLEIFIKLRMVKYWAKLNTGTDYKLPFILYRLSLKKYKNLKWIEYVKSILDDCGKSYVWNTHFFPSVSWLHNSIKQTLIDHFKKNWLSNVHTKLLIIESIKRN